MHQLTSCFWSGCGVVILRYQKLKHPVDIKSISCTLISSYWKKYIFSIKWNTCDMVQLYVHDILDNIKITVYFSVDIFEKENNSTLVSASEFRH